MITLLILLIGLSINIYLYLLKLELWFDHFYCDVLIHIIHGAILKLLATWSIGKKVDERYFDRNKPTKKNILSLHLTNKLFESRSGPQNSLLLLSIKSGLLGFYGIIYPTMTRSSRPEVFFKLGVIKNLSKFTGKYLCQSLF